MDQDTHILKKGLLRTGNRAVNVADLVRRNKFERKKERKHNLIFVMMAMSVLAISLFIIAL